ncbi:glycosyltransferase family 2 protein [Flavobacterium sp. XN-5]|uniref:glycosyltransferase family 2 protein n=1 Tax=Flavobacterium sp. XN-5 TaxID=2599390 RepID=UPI0011CAECC7|nr:glycosyltransferase family A protein [Flavobacterium sp. XN-5]NGY35938.1 glycosyltransferase family 2 protein [Flavobacterium sp. XN-5]
MLSILIPIYNYNAFPLVKELHQQCLESKIKFEIICVDDASYEHQSENILIQFLSNSTYIELPQNIGRSAIRNLLASKSKLDWLLFLDCDTFPESANFVSNYRDYIKSTTKNAFFGGLLYTKEKPADEKLLRWTFGKNREAIPLADRTNNPYATAFVSNFVIQKSVFETIFFDEKISTYGYEDYSFITTLKDRKISIQHIENPVFHLNLETSELFLSKTKTALKTLSSISNCNSKITTESKITQLHKTLSLLKLDSLVSKLFQRFRFKLEENLTSKKPSLIAFDIYKIGYFCFLNRK